MAVRDYVARYVADLTGYKLDPVIRDTKELEKTSGDTADGVTGDFRTMTRAAQTAGQDITSHLDDTGRGLKTSMGGAGLDAGSSLADSLKKGVVDGDIGGALGDIAQNATGALAAVPIVGGALAAGASIAVAMWQGFQERTKAQEEATRKAAAEVFQGLITDGAAFAEKFQTDVVQKFFDPGNTDELTVAAKEAAAVLGDDLGGAIAGGSDSITAKLAELEKAQSHVSDGAASMTQVQKAQLEEKKKVYQREIDYLQSIQGGWSTAEQAARDYNRAIMNAKLAPAVKSTLAAGARDAGQVPYATGGRS